MAQDTNTRAAVKSNMLQQLKKHPDPIGFVIDNLDDLELPHEIKYLFESSCQKIPKGSARDIAIDFVTAIPHEVDTEKLRLSSKKFMLKSIYAGLGDIELKSNIEHQAILATAAEHFKVGDCGKLAIVRQQIAENANPSNHFLHRLIDLMHKYTCDHQNGCVYLKEAIELVSEQITAGSREDKEIRMKAYFADMRSRLIRFLRKHQYIN